MFRFFPANEQAGNGGKERESWTIAAFEIAESR